MKFAIFGYGKMGREIEEIAKLRNHQIELKIDVDNYKTVSDSDLKKCDVAFEFSTPDTVYENTLRCFDCNLPVVVGTTGWLERLDEIKEQCITKSGAMIYSANYSIGMNILFAINQYLARLMSDFPQYEVDIHETHHIHKKDAPSGTAIKLANDIIANHSRKEKWVTRQPIRPDEIQIHSYREGEIPGTHSVQYRSNIDTLTITHEAHNRQGFAIGAVMAAEWLKGKKGFFTMNDFLKI